LHHMSACILAKAGGMPPPTPVLVKPSGFDASKMDAVLRSHGTVSAAMNAAASAAARASDPLRTLGESLQAAAVQAKAEEKLAGLEPQRRVLYVQGFARGIPRKDMEAAKARLEADVRASKATATPFTTLVFDGDPMPCAPPSSDPYGFPNGASSFVFAIAHLRELFPELELIYFKKEAKVDKCLSDLHPEPSSEVFPEGAPKEWRQWYGAWPDLTSANTKVVRMTDPFVEPFDATTRNLAVGTSEGKYYQVTIDAMGWLRSKLRVDEVTVVVLGGGGTVKKAMEKLREMDVLSYPEMKLISIPVERVDGAVGPDGELLKPDKNGRPLGVAGDD
jgi:hypothetical protein